MDKESNSRLSVCQHWHLTQERHVWTQNMRNVFEGKNYSMDLCACLVWWPSGHSKHMFCTGWVPGSRWHGLATLSRKRGAFEL